MKGSFFFTHEMDHFNGIIPSQTYFHSGQRWQLEASLFNNKAASMRLCHCMHELCPLSAHIPLRRDIHPDHIDNTLGLCCVCPLGLVRENFPMGKTEDGSPWGDTFPPQAPSYGRMLECLARLCAVIATVSIILAL